MIRRRSYFHANNDGDYGFFALLIAALFISVMCGTFAAQFSDSSDLSFSYLPFSSASPFLTVIFSSFIAIRPVLITSFFSFFTYASGLIFCFLIFYLFSFSYTLSLMTVYGATFSSPLFFEFVFSFIFILPVCVYLLYTCRNRRERLTPISVLVTVLFSFLCVLAVRSAVYIVTFLF